MGSKTSIGEGPTAAEVKTVIVPIIPLDIVDEILNHLAAGVFLGRLRACALVSKSWIPSCRQHLFHTVRFDSKTVGRWLKTFPVPEQSPAHYVRDLHIWAERYGWAPENFFEHTPRFINVRSIRISGLEKDSVYWIPLRWRLPECITSLTIDSNEVTLLEIRDIMARLPNLDNLELPGPLFPADRTELLGIGTVLRGRFGGRLRLRNVCYDSKDIVNMLLEIPTGLRFTEIGVDCARQCLPSVVTLVESCCQTIAKLSHMVTSDCKSHPFSWFG